VHKLLERQLKKLGLEATPPRFDKFVDAVDAAYQQADRDRQMVERSLELASSELFERNQQLREDIERRKRLEIELAQAEKLRAVGQLASGIAHELNTPIQYVGDNTSFLKHAFGVLLPLIQQTIAQSNGGVPRRDLDFLCAQIPEAIEATLEGCNRVAEIVGAMKMFAHSDRNEHAAADINRALTATLAVARNHLKYVAEVTLDLGQLPDVECNIGELNQVFLNLLVNAGDAVQDKHQGAALGRVCVTTRHDGERVVIEVSDDGCGIPEAARGHIFEPFFTTKEVGRGSGQGLAISRSIVVDKHGGALSFVTTLGQGTTFRIELPLKRSSTSLPVPAAAAGPVATRRPPERVSLEAP
jgi:two-component system, NtrC family, sensor kinase